MLEKDKLFQFLEGLKPWAQTELDKRGVQVLAAAIATAECLTDFASFDLEAAFEQFQSPC